MQKPGTPTFKQYCKDINFVPVYTPSLNPNCDKPDCLPSIVAAMNAYIKLYGYPSRSN